MGITAGANQQTRLRANSSTETASWQMYRFFSSQRSGRDPPPLSRTVNVLYPLFHTVHSSLLSNWICSFANFFVSTVEENPQLGGAKLCALWQTLWRTPVLSFFGVCARTYTLTYLSFSLPKCTRTHMVRTDEGSASNEVTAQENKEARVPRRNYETTQPIDRSSREKLAHVGTHTHSTSTSPQK